MNFQALKKQFFIVEFYTHYKFIGHVIISKPHCSSREGINSHCRRFNWLLFAVLVESVAAMYYRSCCGFDVAGHSAVTVLLPVPLVHSTATCARVGLLDSLWMFFALCTAIHTVLYFKSLFMFDKLVRVFLFTT